MVTKGRYRGVERCAGDGAEQVYGVLVATKCSICHASLDASTIGFPRIRRELSNERTDCILSSRTPYYALFAESAGVM
jgi:hypothetical protein